MPRVIPDRLNKVDFNRIRQNYICFDLIDPSFSALKWKSNIILIQNLKHQVNYCNFKSWFYTDEITLTHQFEIQLKIKSKKSLFLTNIHRLYGKQFWIFNPIGTTAYLQDVYKNHNLDSTHVWYTEWNCLKFNNTNLKLYIHYFWKKLQEKFFFKFSLLNSSSMPLVKSNFFYCYQIFWFLYQQQIKLKYLSVKNLELFCYIFTYK